MANKSHVTNLEMKPENSDRAANEPSVTNSKNQPKMASEPFVTNFEIWIFTCQRAEFVSVHLSDFQIPIAASESVREAIEFQLLYRTLSGNAIESRLLVTRSVQECDQIPFFGIGVSPGVR
jgi:hypothetical protein